MAKIVTANSPASTKTKRPGIHSKTKTSKLQSSRHYKKSYRGQGR
jgi:hypothetical protein